MSGVVRGQKVYEVGKRAAEVLLVRGVIGLHRLSGTVEVPQGSPRRLSRRVADPLDEVLASRTSAATVEEASDLEGLGTVLVLDDGRGARVRRSAVRVRGAAVVVRLQPADVQHRMDVDRRG